MDKEQMDTCRDRCLMVGEELHRGAKGEPIIYADNWKWLASTKVGIEGFIVPHSELAMHVHAAGKPIRAFSITEEGRYAHIAYDDAKCCGYTHGTVNEVLPHELIEVWNKIFGRQAVSQTT